MTADPPPRLAIISATRHEAGNVAELTARISRHLASEDIAWEILFVDDSDDETPHAIAALARSGAPVRMLHRPAGQRPGGLSGALTLGFASVEADLIAVIDADLQHLPELLQTMVRPLLDDAADLVIASRYAVGGSADGLAGPFRQWASRSSIVIGRALFPQVRPIRDPVSGFFAMRREVVEDVDLRPEGFKMLVEILVRGRCPRIVEIPYRFVGRESGASKVTLRLGLLYFRHVGRLWLECRTPGVIARLAPKNPAHRAGRVLTEQDPRWSVGAGPTAR